MAAQDSTHRQAHTQQRAVLLDGQRGVLGASRRETASTRQPGREPALVVGMPVSGPIDIVGAGDAATSGLVTALLAGASELEAAELGNLVASITIQQLGTTGTASPQQVRERWNELRA